ncbi:MAG: membrane protein insertase YidC [Desulfobacterales bacterium]|nr:membrane protein insertase YidC [Desulfobacterales bacterium]MCP4160993.1 membrane protein insertase YidC [Deltaproteobacteria bacterium]
MEQFRLFIAITLSVLVFVVWNFFFVEKPKEPIKKPAVAKQIGEKADKSKTAVKEIEKSNTIVNKVEPVDVNRIEKFYTIETPLYIVKISDKGANFRSFTLKNYKESNDKKDLKELVVNKETLNVSFKQQSVKNLEKAYFSTNSLSNLKITNSPKDIVFSYTSQDGITVEKRYTFDNKTYLINCDVIVKNNSKSSFNDTLQTSLIAGNPESRMSDVGPSAYFNGSVEYLKIGDLDDKNSITGNIKWASFQDTYFLSSIIPTKKDQESRLKVICDNPKDKKALSKTTLENKLDVVQPGNQLTYNFKVFMGPMTTTVLDESGYDLSKALDFGFFDFVGKPCLWVMNQIYKAIPNYGIAIILLTLFIKIILWPLGNKGYKSMNEMKKLQPLMTEIREKYKDDKKKMNEEVMGLYKTYKINPLGGCLPMIAQLPVFFAFYQMLFQAIELRHAPFFGWITDLSAPDRLFSGLDFLSIIPMFDPPYGIPVLTILMGASMFLQQKMTPQAGDATQAKIMMMMPVVMTFVFMNFSSGLVLYWFVNNLFSIAQQYYTMKKKVK